jgi:competence protein CoiA
MTQSAWTRDGGPVGAAAISSARMRSAKADHAARPFRNAMPQGAGGAKDQHQRLALFAHLSDECATAPEPKWHKTGKAAVMAALDGKGIVGSEEVPGRSSSGDKREADVLFSVPGRTIVIELQRSYQHLRDFIPRQERYTASAVEYYWLVCEENFRTLGRRRHACC